MFFTQAPESVPSWSGHLVGPYEGENLPALATSQATQEVALAWYAEKELIYPQPIDQENLGAVVFSVTVVIGSHDLGVGGMSNFPDIVFCL